MDDPAVCSLFSLIGGAVLGWMAAPKSKSEPRTAPDEPWMHDLDEDVPFGEHWKLFVAQWEQADSDDERLNVLAYWLDAGNEFTTWEETVMLDMAGTAEMRKTVRSMLAEAERNLQKAEAAKAQPEPEAVG